MWSLKQTNYPTVMVGDSGKSLAQIGCVTTCLSALSEWYASKFFSDRNKSTMPEKLVKQLKYTKDGLLLWKSIDDSNLPFKFVYRYYSRNDYLIKSILRSSLGSCMLQVNNGSHWVVLVGDSKLMGYKIYDPLYGDIVWLRSRYGGGIQGFVSFVKK